MGDALHRSNHSGSASVGRWSGSLRLGWVGRAHTTTGRSERGSYVARKPTAGQHGHPGSATRGPCGPRRLYATYRLPTRKTDETAGPVPVGIPLPRFTVSPPVDRARAREKVLKEALKHGEEISWLSNDDPEYSVEVNGWFKDTFYLLQHTAGVAEASVFQSAWQPDPAQPGAGLHNAHARRMAQLRATINRLQHIPIPDSWEPPKP